MYLLSLTAYSNGLAMAGSCSASTYHPAFIIVFFKNIKIGLKSITPSPGTVNVPLRTPSKAKIICFYFSNDFITHIFLNVHGKFGLCISPNTSSIAFVSLQNNRYDQNQIANTSSLTTAIYLSISAGFE